MLRSSVLSCFFLLIATGGAAQPGQAPPPSATAAPVDESAPVENDEIVVTGQIPMTPRRFEEAVSQFVRQRSEAGPINQISRWGEPVCPKTDGLSSDFNDFVTARIKDVAARVGAPGPGDCPQANVWVIFTTEPHRFMAHIRDEHRGLLGYHFVGERRALAAFEPPMKSWYVTTTSIPGAYQAFDYAYGQGPPGGTGSRIRPQYKSRFGFVLVVVDSNPLEGQAIGPVADRIAVLALSNPAATEGCSPLPSIMDLLDPQCPAAHAAEGLTAYDETYLKALYAFDQDELKGYMRQTIAKRVADELGPP